MLSEDSIYRLTTAKRSPCSANSMCSKTFELTEVADERMREQDPVKL